METEQEQPKENVVTNNISYGKQDVINLPELIEAVIVDIQPKKARDVFGDKATTPEQDVITIHYENSELGFKGDQTINHYPIGKVPSKSKLGKFIDKYDGLCVGKKIKLLQTKEGYFNIILE